MALIPGRPHEGPLFHSRMIRPVVGSREAAYLEIRISPHFKAFIELRRYRFNSPHPGPK